MKFGDATASAPFPSVIIVFGPVREREGCLAGHRWPFLRKSSERRYLQITTDIL